MQILLQTFAIMGKSINSWELKDADVVVRPALVGMGSGDFAGKRRAIEAGRTAMRRHAAATEGGAGGQGARAMKKAPGLATGGQWILNH